jgi:hypothetical protein
MKIKWKEAWSLFLEALPRTYKPALIKNTLILAPILLLPFHFSWIIRGLLAFGGFCLLQASYFHVRVILTQHNVHRNRVVLLLFLFGSAMAVGGYLGLGVLFWYVVAFALYLGYGSTAKNWAAWDIALVASGYCLRFLIGANAIGDMRGASGLVALAFLGAYAGLANRRLGIKAQRTRDKKRDISELDSILKLVALGTIGVYAILILLAHHTHDLILSLVSVGIVAATLVRHLYMMLAKSNTQTLVDFVLTDRWMKIGIASWAIVWIIFHFV